MFWLLDERIHCMSFAGIISVLLCVRTGCGMFLGLKALLFPTQPKLKITHVKDMPIFFTVQLSMYTYIDRFYLNCAMDSLSLKAFSETLWCLLCWPIFPAVYYVIELPTNLILSDFIRETAKKPVVTLQLVWSMPELKDWTAYQIKVLSWKLTHLLYYWL